MEEIRNVVWPEWKTVRRLGSGGFGTVYEIEREVYGQKPAKAALKHIRIPKDPSEIEALRSSGWDDASITEVFHSKLQRITNEFALMKQLSGSSYVVSCDDIHTEALKDGFGWDVLIKMELLTPLVQTLPDPIPEETVFQVARDMCMALCLCERNNIVHRDIKPQNILLSPLGSYKLGDFGIAKTMEQTTAATVTGTYNYMAPEVCLMQRYGHTADIYSLGLVLYWMLNRKRMPFLPLPPELIPHDGVENARNRRLSGEPLPPPADGSKALQQIVLKACAFDPKDRYRTAEEMLHALNGQPDTKTIRILPDDDRVKVDPPPTDPFMTPDPPQPVDPPVPKPSPVSARNKTLRGILIAVLAALCAVLSGILAGPAVTAALLMIAGIVLLLLFFRKRKHAPDGSSHWMLSKEALYLGDGSLNSWCDYQYDENGNMIRENRYYSEGSAVNQIKYKYDADGNEIRRIQFNGDGSVDVLCESEYDADGNKLQETQRNSDGGVRLWIKYSYDANGNRVKYVRYQGDGSIDSWGKYEYDAKGNMCRETRYSADSRVDSWRKYKYDARGNQTKRIEYRGDGSVDLRGQYEYDPDGRQSRYIEYDRSGGVSYWTDYEYTRIP